MPAEKIQTPGRPGETDRPHLRIAWGHDCQYVQIASLFDAKQGADFIIGTVNEWLKAAGLDEIPGREELERLIAAHTPDPDALVRQFGIGFEGFHMTLEQRHAANRLIKVMRDARNDAWGRDE